MDNTNQRSASIVDVDNLPALYPTHRHETVFWEHLGRTIATFGFLENVLARAIFSFTATMQYPENEIDEAFRKWLPTLERALKDPLGNLIDSYAKAVRNNPSAKFINFDDLTKQLRSAATIRNVLCHGSWNLPDENGMSLPFFINKQLLVFDTPIDVFYLQKTRRATAELACEVVTSVTCMGWQFPGTNGPGDPIYKSKT